MCNLHIPESRTQFIILSFRFYKILPSLCVGANTRLLLTIHQVARDGTQIPAQLMLPASGSHPSLGLSMQM